MHHHVYLLISALIVLINVSAALGAAFLGISEGDISLFFQERETITFLSALQLGLAGLISLFVYLIERLDIHRNRWRQHSSVTWLLSFFLLAFACCDEFFMIHEGIDGAVLSFFWGITENLHLDGFTLSLYGLCALLLFLRHRREFLSHKAAMYMFALCGVFFLASISLDIGSIDRVRITYEESAKLIAVSFLLNGFIFVFRDAYTDLAKAVGSR